MITGTTQSGFSFEISEENLSDWRFVKKLKSLQKFEKMEATKDTELKFVELMIDVETFLFDDNGEALEDHVASLNDGRVPLDKFLIELVDILKTNEKTKN